MYVVYRNILEYKLMFTFTYSISLINKDDHSSSTEPP